MNVALTTTSEQQRKVYDEGVPAYSESTLVPFSKRDYDPAKGELLPIELQKPPPNFRSEINFAVNLFDLADKYKHLRASLLWAIFGKTIVVKDLEHAQRYREHLVKQRKSCPAILTLNGDMIASDGLMDPKRKCPSHIDVLKFSFGELPPSEKEECRSLQVTLSKLENLRRVLTETDAVANRLKQAEGQLKTEKESLTPVINDYERQLRKLRPNDSLDQISTPTSTKRRRK